MFEVQDRPALADRFIEREIESEPGAEQHHVFGIAVYRRRQAAAVVDEAVLGDQIDPTAGAPRETGNQRDGMGVVEIGEVLVRRGQRRLPTGLQIRPVHVAHGADHGV